MIDVAIALSFMLAGGALAVAVMLLWPSRPTDDHLTRTTDLRRAAATAERDRYRRVIETALANLAQRKEPVQ